MKRADRHDEHREATSGAESAHEARPRADGGEGPRLHVAMVSPEIRPFAKTGGLADMVGALSLTLARLGLKVSLVMPAYGCVLRGGFPLEEAGMRLSVPVSDRREEATVLTMRVERGMSLYLIRADRYFDREYLYGTRDGDYPDNAERFVFFSRAVLETLRADPPQVLHCHDWQTALAIAFLKSQPERYPELSAVKTVFTVHNLGYQGLFAHSDWHLLNLNGSLFTPRHLDFYGRINFLKGGLVFADRITTVSPTYAEEIKTPEHGFGLEGVLRERAASVVGILNGADYSLWNPETDPFIARRYGVEDLSGKQICKTDVQRTFGLPERPEVPLFAMISRLTSQKGLDLLGHASDDLFRREVQFVLLGDGERWYEERFTAVAARYPGQAACHIGLDEALSHRIEAGADLFLMPSRYEPCGLSQLYSLKYGTIPVVRATGGLKDTVQEYDPEGRTGNGFVFGPFEASALVAAVDRALDLFRRPTEWSTLIKRAMAADFSWDRSARAYADLYQRLLD